MSKEEKAIELGDILLQNSLKRNEVLEQEIKLLREKIAELKAITSIRNDYVEKISSLSEIKSD